MTPQPEQPQLPARQHALEADRLLGEHADLLRRAADPDVRLRLEAQDRVTQFNRDLDWLLRRAQAHALTALALHQALPIR